jgi:hypothetical protein
MPTKTPIELSSTPSIVDNGDATAITIDSSENVGFSITPESHYSDYTNLDFGKTGLLLSASSGTNITSLLNNAYLNSSIDWKYKEADEASKYDQTGGTHLWFTAPTGGSADADLTWTQRLRLDSDGLKFGTDTAAANALDDYEEGTWQAVHGGNNMTGNGYYVKVGSLVHFQGDWTSASGSTTAAVITGLPFNPSTSRGQSAFTVGYTTDSGGQTGGATLFSDTLAFYTNSAAQNLAAGERVIVQGTYSTAE